jgi:hypothetical protein
MSVGAGLALGLSVLGFFLCIGMAHFGEHLASLTVKIFLRHYEDKLPPEARP